MIFNKLIIKNFKQYKEIELDLSPDLNILCGDNESGKSTILEAIALVTTGRFRGKKFESFLSNDIFNVEVVEKYLKSLSTSSKSSPPEIVIELYANDISEHAKYKGTNNSKGADVPGVKYLIKFNNHYSDAYKELLKINQIQDIPLEFYHYEWKNFAESGINPYSNTVFASIIDTSQVNNNILGSYIGQEIKENLSEEDKRNLGSAYRSIRSRFSEEEALQRLNKEIAIRTASIVKNLGISLVSTTTSEWQNELSLSVNFIPFSFLGRGTQNIIKTNLALGNIPDKTVILLIEEPENNLSFGNMAKLIGSITDQNHGKQIFIATHSSFVANKLGLDKLILLTQKSQRRLSELPTETIRYFKKLPNYETLRMVITEKVILVEGSTDELIVQAAYIKRYSKLPISDGIDIISVNSLAFKRFCDIATLIDKKISIITDNDGDIEKNITDKYNDYKKQITDEIINIYYDRDENNNTLEDSFLHANETKIVELGKLFCKSDNILEYMKSHKTEWALRVFERASDFEYPEQINECINRIKE